MNTVRVFLIVLVAIALSLAPSTVLAQSSILHIVVLYDKNNDGQEEGVGPNVLVELDKDGKLVGFDATNIESEATFSVVHGHYDAEAFPQKTNPFYTWVCVGGKSVDMAQEFLFIHCKEVFFIQIPFIHS